VTDKIQQAAYELSWRLRPNLGKLKTAAKLMFHVDTSGFTDDEILEVVEQACKMARESHTFEFRTVYSQTA
jgi:hypothetical protein